MDELQALIASQSWDQAIVHAESVGVSTDVVHQSRWLAHPSSISCLSSIHDHRWVAAAALNARLDDAQAQKDILYIGIKATNQLAKDAGVDIAPSSSSTSSSTSTQPILQEQLHSAGPSFEATCNLRINLLQMLYLVETYNELSKIPKQQHNPKGTDPSSPFASFMSRSILHNALLFAAMADIDSLRALFKRHYRQLFLHRFDIFESIPEDYHPKYYADLFPSIRNGREIFYINEDSSETAHPEDWVYSLTMATFLKREDTNLASLRQYLLSAEELAEWYMDMIEHVDNKFQNIRITFSFVDIISSGALNGEDGNECSKRIHSLAKELSILEKYDALYSHSSNDQINSRGGWTMDKWNKLSQDAKLNTFLSHSTPDTISYHFSNLVIPFLEIHSTTTSTWVNEFILETAHSNLRLLTSLFQSSKPTLPIEKRIIKSDTDLIALSLACLYTSPQTNMWNQMTLIYECLPAFQEQKENVENARIFLKSLFSTSTVTPKSVFEKTSSCSKGMLSTLLDHLDVHIEQAERFSRWDLPTPLSWFITAVDDSKAQVSVATTLSRREIGQRGEFESDDEWMALLEDIVSWAVPARNEDDVKPALNCLDENTVLKIFFSSVLSTGRFSLAKNLFNPSNGSRPLDPNIQESLVISTSREFYDNSESGNLNKGNMKKALECLSVAPPTPTIRAERDFIEATSRLTSFRLTSVNGDHLLSPIEIRLCKDRLELISRLLSTNKEAYMYPDMVLDIVHKLGHRDDSAQVRVFAMIVNVSLNMENYVHAANVCERMVGILEKLYGKKRDVRNKEQVNSLDSGVEMAWKAISDVANENRFPDYNERLRLLSHSLRFCPASEISRLADSYRRLQRTCATSENNNNNNAPTTPTISSSRFPSFTSQRLNTMPSSSSITSTLSRTSPLPSPSLSLLQNNNSGSSSNHNLLNATDVAERAARSFGRAAASYFGGGREGEVSSSSSSSLSSISSSWLGGNSSMSNTHASRAKTVPSPVQSQNQQSRRSHEFNDTQLTSSPSSSLSFDQQQQQGRPHQGQNQGQQRDDSVHDFASSVGNVISDRFTAGVGWLIGVDEEE